MTSPSTSNQPSGVERSSLSENLHQGFMAPFRLQTYKNLLYLALAFPLGIVYFVGVTIGLALGFGLLVTLVGLPILLITLVAATVVAGFEAKLARSLCGVKVSAPTVLTEFDVSDRLEFPGDGFFDAVRGLAMARATWTSVLLVLTKFGFGVLSFVALTVSGAVTGAFLAAPFIYDDPAVILGVGGVILGGEYVPQSWAVDAFPETFGWIIVEEGFIVGPWVVETFTEAILAAVVGIMFFFVAVNLLNGLAQFQARYTVKILQNMD